MNALKQFFMGPSINQAYLTQDEKRMLKLVNDKEAQIKRSSGGLRPAAHMTSIYKKFDLVDNLTNSLKNSVQQVKTRIATETDPTKISQLTKQLAVKQKNLKTAQSFRPKGKKEDYIYQFSPY